MSIKSSPINGHTSERTLWGQNPSLMPTSMPFVSQKTTFRSLSRWHPLFLSLLFFLFLGFPVRADDEVTFYRDIAPIVYENCVSCHRAGEATPFPLTNFHEVSRRARTINKVVHDRYMPPWHANSEVTDFLNVRRLDDSQIDLIDRWIAGGKIEGNVKDDPPLPPFTDGWQLGEPDLILTMGEAFPVPAEGPDIYRNFVLPLALDDLKWVKAIELRPSARKVVHHSLFFFDTTGAARKLDGQDGKPGYSGMVLGKGGGFLGNYVPGATPRLLPGDLARLLPKGADVILSTHFHPSGKAELEKSQIGIYFTDKAPQHKLRDLQVPPAFGAKAGIDIPAGESHYLVEASYTLPDDADAHFITGHAHYLCKNMSMVATLPSGERKILLEIPDWDINWQDTYYFSKPIFLPRGTVLHARIHYDNSAENPKNPNNPPIRVKWGRESTDEMGSVILSLTKASRPETKEEGSTATMTTAADIPALFSEEQSLSSHPRIEQIINSVLRNPKSVFQELDTNKDARLQESEIPAPLRSALLSKFDNDGNGELDQQELHTIREWMLSQKGRGKR